MRIHTHLERGAFYDAATQAQVDFNKFDLHGSRSHHHAYDVTLFGSSTFYTNPGASGRTEHEGHAATWDEWGIFLGHLFKLDPQMKAGDEYRDKATFDIVTDYRFDYAHPQRGLAYEDQHKRHDWGSIEGQAGVRECKTDGCGAIHNWMYRFDKAGV